ncbi:hypothetical protein KVV02_005587 [Mortierella alpina]|uniref:Uncharacterized protein n=1 Tax=Mortierella alpina TaxID=64518 RepID=A0A9P8CVM0_MORAP|nr:hypothetical protein KVV02_005587 [Mortierella alpina]
MTIRKQDFRSNPRKMKGLLYKSQPRLFLKLAFLATVACATVAFLLLGSNDEGSLAKSLRGRIANTDTAEYGMGMLMPFVYSAPKHPQFEIPYNVSLNEHCTKHKSKKHLIYMFVTEWTDTQYHENLRISDEIVFVSEEVEHCPRAKCCVVAKTGFDYWSLDQKVALALKIANNLFDGFITLTKIDDDTYVDYRFFMSLQKNFTENTFFGKFETGWCSSSTIDYVEGPFYTISRRLIHCLLSDYRMCGSGFEDRAVTISIYRNCKDYERRDLRDHYNTHIFHKTLARKNKVLYLHNDNPDTASLMYGVNVQGPPLDTPVLSEQDRSSSDHVTN